MPSEQVWQQHRLPPLVVAARYPRVAMATIAERFEQLVDCDHQVDRDALVCRACGQTVIDVWDGDDDGE